MRPERNTSLEECCSTFVEEFAIVPVHHLRNLRCMEELFFNVVSTAKLQPSARHLQACDMCLEKSMTKSIQISKIQVLHRTLALETAS